MGLLNDFIKRITAKKIVGTYFQMLEGYAPVFSNYDGGVYEMELTRACIHTFATHCSKLSPVVTGADLEGIKQILNGKVNDWMITSQFLYKAATIYQTKNTVWIMPIFDRKERITGFYPVLPNLVEIVNYNGEAYVRFTFANGKIGALRFGECWPVSKYLYKSDVNGETNSALEPTMQLLDMQRQNIEQCIKNSASFRFLAQKTNMAKGTDLKKERDDFVRENFGKDASGLILFPSTFSNIQQINSSAKFVDPEQMKIIENRVYTYFGTNEDILQNKAVGDKWEAYYEGVIEPFVTQLSQAMTIISFSREQIARGNRIEWTANRVQYMTTDAKLNVSKDLFDRGIITTNMVREIWQLPPVEDGDKRFIRKEYAEVSQISNEQNTIDKVETEEQK